MRDDHPRSAGFLEVEENPTIRFAGTGLRQDGDDWIFTSDLTIIGTTRSVDIGLEPLGIDPIGVQGRPASASRGR
jgi:polyisoprenoid-binding protein YceI